MEFIQGFEVTKNYEIGGKRINVIRSNNFVIKSGDFVLLLGDSGAGKTTLLNLIAGLDSISSGELYVDGEDIAKKSLNQLSKWRATHVGVIFQNFNLIPFMSALDNVALPLAFCGVSRGQRARKAKTLLKNVGLASRCTHTPSELSGGEQQRVAIARALVNNPKLIIADEPTGNLDSKNSSDIMELLGRLNKQSNTTIVMATHNPAFAFHATKVIHIFDGHITSQEVVK